VGAWSLEISRGAKRLGQSGERILTKKKKKNKNDYFNKIDKNLNNRLEGSFESG
jgi:hypothetical protein